MRSTNNNNQNIETNGIEAKVNAAPQIDASMQQEILSDEKKILLFDAIKKARMAQGFHQKNSEQVDDDIYKPLADYLQHQQQENNNQGTDKDLFNSNFICFTQDANHLKIDYQSNEELRIEIGKLILSSATILENLDDQSFGIRMNELLTLIFEERGNLSVNKNLPIKQEDAALNKKFFDNLTLIKQELEFELQDASNKKDFLQKLLISLLDKNGNSLQSFLALLNREEYYETIVNNVDNKLGFLIFKIIQSVIKYYIELDHNANNEEKRLLSSEASRHHSQLALQEKIAEKIGSINMTSIDEKNIIQLLLTHPAAMRFFNKYVTKEYFAGCSVKEMLEVFTEVSHAPADLSLALKLFRGQDLYSYMIQFPKEMTQALFHSIIPNLPIDARLKLVLYCKKAGNEYIDDNLIISLEQYFPKLASIAYWQDSTDIKQIIKFLVTLNYDDRFDFALALKDKINDSNQLAAVVSTFSSGTIKVKYDEINKFILAFKDKIKDGNELANVLSAIALAPTNKDIVNQGICRTELAHHLSDKINDCRELIKVLQQLIKNKTRLEFSLKHLEKIKTDIDLTNVLYELNENDVLDFISACKDKIKDGHHLAEKLQFVIETRYMLDLDEITNVVLSFKDKIEDGNQLAKILNLIQDRVSRKQYENRIIITDSLGDKIKDFHQLIAVMGMLDKSKASLVLAKKHQDKIVNCKELIHVLYHLHENECFDLALTLKDRIHDLNELTDLIKSFDRFGLEEQIDIINLFQGHIQNGYQLAHVLATVAYEISSNNDDDPSYIKKQYKRLADLAIGLQDKITNYKELTVVLSQLADHDRLNYALMFLQFIKSTKKLATIKKMLPEEDRSILDENYSIYKATANHSLVKSFFKSKLTFSFSLSRKNTKKDGEPSSDDENNNNNNNSKKRTS